MKQERINRVLAALREQNVSQMLIVDPLSIYYLMEVSVNPGERFYGLLLRQKGRPVLFLNRLFSVEVPAGTEGVWYDDTEAIMEIVARSLEKDAPLGVDKDLKARFLLPLMEQKAAKGFLNTSLAVDVVRGIKEKEEQEKMRRASQINDQAMARFKGLIHEGVTEREVAEQMLQIYLDLGADGFSFSPLVAFGKNAADPHHEPDGTMVQAGDVVLFDVGCKKDGYCSDMTRSFFFRKVSEKHREIYETVRAANAAAIEKIRPGIPLKELDGAARRLIIEKGYGPQFNHRLGHFIGLDEHEFGDVSAGNNTPAVSGMVFSIEPGIYLEGDMGVRIEDLVLVTETGCEVLNRFPKELEVIGS